MVAFDTEFVAEDTYTPHLCLIQVAAHDALAIIDPLAIDDLSPFWNLLTTGGRTTLVHAGREEFRFCKRETGKRPEKLFDTQLAAGLVGIEFPTSYGNLVSKLLKKQLSKGETRTDWRRRPLSDRQIDYALQDVLYLQGIYEQLTEKLTSMQRAGWLEEEIERWQLHVEAAESGERWRKVSGAAGLNSRALAVVHALWTWRESEAQSRNTPPRRVLRDDLIVELARRQSSDTSRISGIRGMNHRGLQRHLPAIASAIAEALSLPNSQCPAKVLRPPAHASLNLIGQFLSTALGSISRNAKLAPGIVGTTQDMRDLVAYRLAVSGSTQSPPPLLATGWRKEVVGTVVEDLLTGLLAIRIRDPLSDEPLEFFPSTEAKPEGT